MLNKGRCVLVRRGGGGRRASGSGCPMQRPALPPHRPLRTQATLCRAHIKRTPLKASHSCGHGRRAAKPEPAVPPRLSRAAQGLASFNSRRARAGQPPRRQCALLWGACAARVAAWAYLLGETASRRPWRKLNMTSDIKGAPRRRRAPASNYAGLRATLRPVIVDAPAGSRRARRSHPWWRGCRCARLRALTRRTP